MRVLRTALAQVVWAVRHSVRRCELDGRLLARKLLLRPADRRHLLLAAVAHVDRLALHEERLPDGHAVRHRDALSRLQHVAKFAFVRVPISLDAHDQHRSGRTLDRVEDRAVHRVPAGLRLKVPRAPKRHASGRRVGILGNETAPRDMQREIAGHRRRAGHEGELFLEFSDAPDGKRHHDRKHRFPIPALGLHVIPEGITALPVVPDVKRLVRLDGRVHEKSDRASRLQHRAVARVLRQKRPLSFAARLQAHPRAPHVWKQPDFHSRISNILFRQTTNTRGHFWRS